MGSNPGGAYREGFVGRDKTHFGDLYALRVLVFGYRLENTLGSPKKKRRER
jgi:hypothetical protein